ncbi:MAG: hypothetical protein PHX77_08195, partial [Candidatus Bipolaricaulis sp.]|nr:hypothetical protein [Candidatus Bipolaricaulis sp.]
MDIEAIPGFRYVDRGPARAYTLGVLMKTRYGLCAWVGVTTQLGRREGGMAMRRWLRRVGFLALGLVVVLGLTGCEWIQELINPGGAGIPWASGSSVPVTSQSIGSAGGVVTVNDPGGPLDGMSIDVPAGAFPTSKTFHVSYTPITGNPGSQITALTPLIEVDNGGEFADEIMTVTVPVVIPDGYFAMGFFVDEHGEFEGMLLVTETSTSITVATAHFSAFLIAAIKSQELLAQSFHDGGFRPMADDWQFTNRGSYIAPGGHCMGQSLTAMWYYTEKRLDGASPLWNLYDNNGDAPASPDFWYDDSDGYRLASTIQKITDWSGWLNKTIEKLQTTDDVFTWLAFLFAIRVTGEPQFVAIWTATEKSGHAMVVYRADVLTATLYIADPNYPGDSTRRITYTNGEFDPYESGANKKEIDAGNSTSYPVIRYHAKSAVIPWSRIAARWEEFELGTAGDDLFPAYTLTMVNDQGDDVPLIDGVTASGDTLEIKASTVSGGATLGYVVRRGTEWLTPSGGTWPLVEGDNRLGIYVVGQTGGVWEYVDFQWVTVRRPAPGNVSGRMEFHLAATIQQDPQYGGPHAGVVGTTMTFRNGSYNPATKTLTASWDGGDFSNTYFEARLSASEDTIEFFRARQTQANVWFAWTNVHEIRGYNLPYSHSDGGSRYFAQNGAQVHTTVDLLTFKTWSTSLGSATNPTEWVGSAG